MQRRKFLKRTWMDLTVWLERVIVTRLVPKRVGPVMRLAFKAPILFHKLGMGGILAGRILILVTRGRRTGKQRLTPVEYGYNQEKKAYYLMSGWGGKSDWYLNARKCPQVELWIGKRRIAGVAASATNEEVTQEMEKVMAAYPKVVRTWSGYSGVQYDGTRASLQKVAEAFPSIWVKTEDPQNGL